MQYKMGGFLEALNPKPGMWPRLHKGTKARDGFWGLGLRDVKASESREKLPQFQPRLLIIR